MSRKSHIHNQIFEDLSRFPPVIRSFSTMKNKHPPPHVRNQLNSGRASLRKKGNMRAISRKAHNYTEVIVQSVAVAMPCVGSARIGRFAK